MKKLILTICLLVMATCAFGQGRVWPSALDNTNDLFDVGGGTPFGNIGGPFHVTTNMWDNNTSTKATWGSSSPNGIEALVGLYSMPKRYVPTAFTLTMPQDATYRNWTNFVFEGSNDTTDGTNGTWDAIQSFSTPVLVWADFRIYQWRSDTYNSDFLATNAYNAFRMRVTNPLSNTTNSGPHLTEIQIFGNEAQTDDITYRVGVGGKRVIVGGKQLVKTVTGPVNNLIDNSNWWTPAELGTNLLGWWDASDISTLTIAGDAVIQMDDKSGNGYDAVSGIGTPDLWKRSINDLNALEYTQAFGEDDSMVATGFSVPSSGDIAVFQVWEWETGVDNTASSAFSMNATPNFDWQFAANSLSYFRGRIVKTGLGGAGTTDFSDTAKNGPSIYNLNFDFNGLGEANGYIDGTFQTNNAYTVKMGLTQDFRIMGARSQFLTIGGNTCETIIVGIVTEAVRQKIEGYLAWKYDLVANLPVSHPYKTERPLK